MEFRLLGPLEVVDEGRPVPLGRGKHRALLALLLLHANEVVATSRLIDELWNESPPPTASKIVRNYVSLLRRALGAEQELLQTHRAGYSLTLGDATLDSARFEQLAESGRRSLSEGDAAGAATLLREGLALWRGPPLADFTYETFAQREIARLEELRLGALEERIEADLRLGRQAELVSELEGLVDEHPLRERLRAQLMLALYRSGRQAEALAAYQEGRRALVDELGLEPGRALQELERGILEQDSALDPPALPARRSPQEARRARRGGLLAAVGGGVLLAAAVAVVVIESRGGAAGLKSVAPDSLARIDPRTNRVTAQIPVGRRPAGVVSANGSLWVASLDDATVTRVAPLRGRIVGTVPTIAAPTGLAAGYRSVWAIGADGVVRRIDPGFEAVVKQVRTLQPGSLMVGGPAAGAVATGNGGVWAASGGFGAAPYVWRIDPRTNKRVARIVTGNAPTGVATGFGSTWVSDGFENTVTRIDPKNVPLITIQVGAVAHGPSAIAVGEGAVWVAESVEDRVVRLDPQSNSVAEKITVGRYPTGIAVGAGSVWVTNAHSGTVSRIDPKTNLVVKTIRIGSSPAGVTVARGSVWVTTQAPAAIPVAAKGGTLRVDFDSSPGPQTDPALYADPTIAYATCAKLLNYPDRPGPQGSQLVPEVARSLPAVSADGRTYTFTIRKGFRFSPPLHETVTAETFKHVIERTLSLKTRSSGALSVVDDIVGLPAYLLGKSQHISGVVARGDRLTIRLVKRSPSFPARIATPFFCAVPRNAPIDPKGVRAMSSAGPYYVSSYAPQRQVVLKRNPNYSGNRPHRLETIVFTLGVPEAKSLADVEANRADYVAYYLPYEQDGRLAAHYGPASRAAAAGRQRYFVNPRLTFGFLALNASRPLFASARMRRAVNYAIDRRALARLGSMISGPGAFTTIPTDQYLPPNMPGFERGSNYPPGGDAVAARRIAGPVHATAVLYSCNLSLCRQQAQQIGHDLSRIGIGIDVKEFPYPVMVERAARPGEPFDIALPAWGADYADPSDILNVLLDPPGDLSHLRSARWAARLDHAAQLSGPARYHAYGKLAVDLARDAAPWVVYANSTSRDFFSDRIGCQTVNPVYGVDLAALCLQRTPRG